MENGVHKSSILRRAVIQRLKRTGKLRSEFFFPSKTGRILQKSKRVTQKKLQYLTKFHLRKATANVVRNGKLRRRRYVLQGSQWPVGPSGKITWNVVPSSGPLSASLSNGVIVDNLIKAFRIWAEVSPLVFRKVDSSSTADITVKFVTGKEGTFRLIRISLAD